MHLVSPNPILVYMRWYKRGKVIGKEMTVKRQRCCHGVDSRVVAVLVYYSPRFECPVIQFGRVRVTKSVG
ncbi:hypothetical protein RchiOBHm_Chr2g0110981 [Rosa chinensis]|uniref:Uncharacterized protein n=1 Tax=Rosa chinensis TaxID=74649 RepID=A0A2P6RPU5_ROSCH|nr:hypothetical protein RchiOBHm_Chr2g0110981 [Rosa chinensis]